MSSEHGKGQFFTDELSEQKMRKTKGKIFKKEKVISAVNWSTLREDRIKM